MSNSQGHPAVVLSSRAARISAAVVAGTGIACLTGYVLGVRQLASVTENGPAMPPATAVGLILAAAGAWLVAPAPPDRGTVRRRAGRAMGATVAVLGVVVIIEHLSGVSAGVDGLLFPDLAAAWRAGTVPGRPSPPSAVLFAVVGLTLVLLDTDARRGHRAARILAPSGVLISVIALFGTLYGVTDPTGRSGLAGMAPNTAMALLVLSAGLLICRPDRPAVRAFTSSGYGGTVVRRIAPTILLTVLLLGVVLHTIERMDLSRRGLGMTVAMTAVVLLVYLALLYAGITLDRAGRQQQRLADALRDKHDFSEAVLESLAEGIAALGPDGEILRVTPRWSEITGYRADEVVGHRPPYPWWQPEEVDQRAATLTSKLSSTTPTEFGTYLVRADGVRIDILATTSPILDKHGNLRMLVTTVRDLTERNLVERERRRLADQLDHLFAMSHDLMCIAGTDGYMKRVNPAWERMFGHPAEEILSRPYLDYVHPDDVASTVEMAEAMASGRVTTVAVDVRFRCRDGAYRWINLRGTLAPDENLIYAIGRDVTEQRQAYEANALLEAIVDSTDEAIVGKDLDGTITSWNRAAVRIYGYTADEVIGRSIRMLFPPDRLAECDEILAHIARGEAVRDHDSVRIRKDGTPIHVGLSISPVRDADGQVIGAAALVSDVTERRHAEEQFRRLVLKAPVAMVIVAADGVIRLVNEHTERLFGYPADELIGERVELLVPHQLRGVHAVHRQHYLSAPVIRSMGAGQELYGQRSDGTQFPVEIGLAPLDTDEGRLVSAVIHDITDRKQVQLALAAARDEAIAAAQLRSQFVAMVSHEIRTPMNGVIGLTNLLLESQLDQSQRRYANAIQVSARALLTIINDILDFSKIEAGRVSLVEGDFHLVDLVDEVVNAAAEASRDKHLEIVGGCIGGVPVAVRGDEVRLRQILLNLMGNAVKFTEHGEVSLRVERAAWQLDAAGGHQRFTFSVSDTGIGIAPADVSRLFDAFIQAESTTSRRFGGTGLGLTICRQLVELMGGELEVDSEPGRGSRFFFTIPLAPAADPDQYRTSARDRLAGCRILVVDDNATSREMLTEHARSWGMLSAAAPDAATALVLLTEAADRGEPYELVLLDQHMPDANGISLAERIIADPAITNPLIVLLSSGVHHPDGPLPAGGGVEVLPKPIGSSELYNCLLRLREPGTARINDEISGPATAPSTVDHGRVLLAEDNDINQMVAVDTLAMLGYDADVARNGVEAVELATTNTYHAILMDCQMPKMDGFEAARELRRREHGSRHTPIIALTAGALAEDRQRCLAAGMDDYLVKPLNPDELRTALERAVTHATH